MSPRPVVSRAVTDDDQLVVEALTHLGRTLAYVEAITRLTHEFVRDVTGAPREEPPPAAVCLHPAESRTALADGRSQCSQCGDWVAEESR
jgi:hypothetical protein